MKWFNSGRNSYRCISSGVTAALYRDPSNKRWMVSCPKVYSKPFSLVSNFADDAKVEAENMIIGSIIEKLAA